MIIFPFIGSLTSLFLGIFVLSRGSDKKANRTYCYWMLAAAIWGLNDFGMYLAPNKEFALNWCKFFIGSIFFIPSTFFYFVLSFLKDDSLTRKKISFVAFGISFIFLFLHGAEFLLKDVRPIFQRYYPIPTQPFFLFIIYFYTFVFYGLYLLIERFKSSVTLLERNRLKYLILGLGISIVGGIFNFILASGIIDIDISPVGHITNIIFNAMVAYAIIKYHLMEIEVVIRRSFIYSGLSLLVTTCFLLSVYAFVRLFQYLKIYEEGDFLPALASGLVIAVIINPVRSGVQHIVDRAFFRERVEQDEAIGALRREITSIKDKEPLLRHIITTLSKTMQIENLSVMLWDEKRHNYTVHTWLGQQQHVSFPQDQPLIHWLTGNKRPLARFSLEDPAWPSESKAKLKQDLDALQAYCCLPLMSKGKLLGVLNLGSRKEELGYSQTEIALLFTMTTQAGIALENTGLQEELKEQLLATIRSLALTVEAKDPKTAGHSDRASDLAVRLAKAFNLPPNLIEATRIGVFLHNIGKIGVSEEILQKEVHALSEDEFWLIKKHPKIGVDILHPLNLSPETIDIVLHHHERIDGRGYPDGLKGDEIALPTRIAIVADAFSAMTSPRSCRSAMKFEEARTELQHGAGSQFCPQVVKTLLSIL